MRIVIASGLLLGHFAVALVDKDCRVQTPYWIVGYVFFVIGSSWESWRNRKNSKSEEER